MVAGPDAASARDVAADKVTAPLRGSARGPCEVPLLWRTGAAVRVGLGASLA